MATCIVTGVAGFIGSHLAERLIANGHQVIGVDVFSDYYPRSIKEANLAALRPMLSFRFVEGDAVELDWPSLLEGADYVLHSAAQAGVRASWGKSFETYVHDNVLATQKLLEAAKDARLKRFVYASSSSVYGAVTTLPVTEDVTPHPISPYGVTKLAAEHLCLLYHKSFGVPVVSLRYFTVYGPRQRPDMAFQRFIRAMLHDEPLIIYGDGRQTRDCTFVADAVEATISAMTAACEGEVFNIGGGATTPLIEILRMLEEIIGRPARVEYVATQKGDPLHTWADISKARRILGYAPRVALREGLTRQVEWLRQKG